MDVYEFLSSYFPPPMIGFLLGIGVGFGGGLIFSKGFFLYLSDGRRLKSENLRYERDRDREDRAKEQARREAAVQRRLESMRRRANERASVQKEAEERSRYFDGLYFDECGNPCCPACRTPLASCGTGSARYGGRFGGTCVKCGKLIHSNSNADVVMRHMRKLKSR